MECNYFKVEKVFSDYIINLIGPNSNQDYSREMKFKSIKKVLENGFYLENGITPHVFSFGSFPLRTYMSDSDMDITIILEDRMTGNIISNYSYEYLNKILFLIQNSLENHNMEVGFNQITDINIILADVKLVKCKFENISFDISVNNFVGMCKLVFFHYLENNSFKNNFEMFKRSLFLIKAWCYYEGSILGSNIGLLASYALEILVVYMFNNYHNVFQSEVECFFAFFKIMNEIDWDKNIVTVFGLLNLENFYEVLKSCDFNLDLMLSQEYGKTSTNTNKRLIKIEEIAIFNKMFEKYHDLDRVQNFNSNKRAINMKFINIIDPLFQTNNLGKSVNYHNFSKIRKVFEYMTGEVLNFLKLKSLNKFSPLEYLNHLLKFFSKIVISNNPELFFMTLPQPKIIIIPSNLNNTNNTSIMEKENQQNQQQDSNMFNYNQNNHESIISKFNKKFSSQNSQSSIIDGSLNKCNKNPFIKNPLTNFFWPSK
jgi:hypothetical protein